MKPLSETTLCRKLSAFCGTLGHYSVGHDCELTLSLYADEATRTPECSHHIKGSSRHNLLILIALTAAVALALGLIKKLCCLCKN